MEVSADMRVCLEVMKASWYPNDKVDLFKLVEQLKGMVNNAEFSDVAFLCEDGVKVHAYRMFLAARSSVFRKTLQNGMAESKSDVIRLPPVASSTLIECLASPGSAARFLEDGDELKLFGSELHSQITKSREKFVLSITKREFKNLLPLVNLNCIPPELLIVIVSPLNIIDSQVLGDVLDSQAIRGFRSPVHPGGIYRWTVLPESKWNGRTVGVN
ncbi:hypothetical protein R1flu_028905 [Riccia fluitans]|uniref:BTB domain-containing protein n=1 Tax=Riccia fluitans TaxID=41844 RepID=A0ABD1XN39_9MARC